MYTLDLTEPISTFWLKTSNHTNTEFFCRKSGRKGNIIFPSNLKLLAYGFRPVSVKKQKESNKEGGSAGPSWAPQYCLQASVFTDEYLKWPGATPILKNRYYRSKVKFYEKY